MLCVLGVFVVVLCVDLKKVFGRPWVVLMHSAGA